MVEHIHTYTPRVEINGGATRYYISFSDGQGIRRETEVTRPVYLEFLRFARAERNLRRWDERHVEQSGLTEEALHERALQKPQSLEEAAADRMRDEYLALVIRQLPETQRRRFILYYEIGLTYGQIAEREGCTKMAVKYTVDKAKEAIIKKLREFTG